MKGRQENENKIISPRTAQDIKMKYLFLIDFNLLMSIFNYLTPIDFSKVSLATLYSKTASTKFS